MIPTNKHNSNHVNLENYSRRVDNSSDAEDDYIPECGIGRFKPKSFRKFANMTAFTGALGVCGLVTNTLSSYVNGQVTTLERQFGFSSTQTGIIMAGNDIGFLIVVLFASYVANRVHIPHALGIVTIFFGVSGLICAIPHFIFGAPIPPKSSSASNVRLNSRFQTSAIESNFSQDLGMDQSAKQIGISSSFIGQLCDGVNGSSLNCELNATNAASQGGENQSHAYSEAALWIIVAGMILQGIAKAPRTSFITAYVDGNIDKVKTGFYLGIITTLSMMGPALSYAFGGLFTKLYVTLEDTDITPTHPKWVGAWWLGFVTFGSAGCILGLPLLLFPKWIKGRHKSDIIKAEKEKYPTVNQKSVVKIVEEVKGFVSTVVRLLTNPIYVCLLLSSCALVFALAGNQTFGNKYIEHQFSMPVWKTNMAMAGTTLCTTCLGTLLGGYITKRFKMGPLLSLKISCLMIFLSVTLRGFKIFFKCEQPYIYNSPGPRAISDPATAGCFDSCGCNSDEYFPVCGVDGRTYFSPCHAGCTEASGKRSYANCTCIAGGSAVPGMCDYSCPMFYAYLIVNSLSSLIGTTGIMPTVIVSLRCVEERDKAFSVGFVSFVTSITGWLFGPIIFGSLLDGMCLQWDYTCKGLGACRLYDNDLLRYKLIGYQTAFWAVTFLFKLIALIYAIVTKHFDRINPSRNPMKHELVLDKMPDVTKPMIQSEGNAK